MPTLHLHTSIRAPIHRVFDLCRSVEAHTQSAHRTAERAVAGTTHGLLALGDHVTWSARHLGWRWRLTSRITRFDRPRHFRDSMVDGPFARFDHDHTFAERDGTTEVHTSSTTPARSDCWAGSPTRCWSNATCAAS